MDCLDLGNFITSLVSTSIVSLVLGLSPTIIRTLRRASVKRNARMLFGKPGSACIVVPVRDDPTTDRRRMLTAEAAMARQRLRDHLLRLGWEVNLEYSRNVEVIKEYCKSSTMFFLGSTRAYSVMIDLFEELKSDFTFEDTAEGPRIFERDGAIYSSPKDQNAKVRADYGLLIKIDNHFCPEKKYFGWLGYMGSGPWERQSFFVRIRASVRFCLVSIREISQR